jgi:hypothetical protein
LRYWLISFGLPAAACAAPVLGLVGKVFGSEAAFFIVATIVIPLLVAVISNQRAERTVVFNEEILNHDDALIPLLCDLESDESYGAPSGFVKRYTRVHNDDWRQAQDHWELVMALALRTDAVHPAAGGRVAIGQAARAASKILARAGKEGRCPICRRGVR